MMSPPDKAPLTNILQNCIENLMITENQIREKDNYREDENFTLDKFWASMNMVAKKLSFDCTKICISFSQTPIPSPSETSSLLSALEQSVLGLASTWFGLPPSCGRCLRDEVNLAAVYATQAARQLLKLIKDEGCAAMSERYRQSTGVVWTGCTKLECCPKNNKTAVLHTLNSQNSLVCDAFTEISEALEGDGSGWSCLGDDDEDEEEDEKWTNEDKDLLGPSVNLIKAAKILYKRVIAAVEKNGSVSSVEAIKELDTLAEDCREVSKTIDTLILDLYPPLNVNNMEEQSLHLAELLNTALKTCTQSHIATEEEQPQIEFVHKAIEHNLDRMKEKLSQR